MTSFTDFPLNETGCRVCLDRERWSSIHVVHVQAQREEADPLSLGPGSFCGGECQIGGAWSSYSYNNFIYESDITAGLRVYGLSDKARAGAYRLDRLNPQTQEALPR